MFRNGPSVPTGAVLLGLLVCFGGPLQADPQANGVSPAEIQRAEDQDPKVCKRFKPTGSNISKSYCFRKSAWDRMREDSQRALRDISDRASVNTGSGEGRR